MNGVDKSANNCSEPSQPTIAKVGVSATDNPSNPSEWRVTYQVTVTAGASDTFYSLSDTPGFPVGATLGVGNAQRTDIPSQPC